MHLFILFVGNNYRSLKNYFYKIPLLNIFKCKSILINYNLLSITYLVGNSFNIGMFKLGE